MDYSPVLVVDDQNAEAEAFAELVSARTGLRAVFTSDPAEAIRICEESFITVVVLDERMPAMRGTELYARIRDISPNTAAIMLTQESDVEAASKAIQLQYKERLHKSRVDELPQVVIRVHAQALASMASAGQNSELLRKGRRFPNRRQEVWLMSAVLVEPHYVVEDGWRHYVEVNVGQEHSETQQRTSIERATYEMESRSTVGSELGIDFNHLGEIAGKVRSSLEDRTAVSLSTEVTSLQVIEDRFKLPPEPSDPSKLHVRTRRIEYAAVYARYRVILKSVCTSCSSARFGIAMVKLPRDMVALRHVDIMSSGEERIVSTGFRRLK